jgi:hypothetical protein
MSSRTTVTAALFAGATILMTAAAPGLAQVNDGRAAFAQSGTAQENAACRRDTRRLCRHIKAGAGNDAFLQCLQAHRAQLSEACRQVLESHGM